MSNTLTITPQAANSVPVTVVGVTPQAVVSAATPAAAPEEPAFEQADIGEFGLAEAPIGVDASGGIVEGARQKIVKVSENAIEMDAWGRRRGKELAKQFAPALTGVDKKQVNAALADFFGVAFLPEPVLSDACVDEGRREFIEQMMETPEFHALKARTVIDDLASELACGSFSESYGKLVLEQQAAAAQNPQQQCNGGPSTNPFRKVMRQMNAIGNALNQAGQQVQGYEDARNAFGAGLGAGCDGTMDTKALAALFKKVRSNKSLARICELAGRYRRRGQSLQRRKITHGRDDMVGVELSGDLGRAVASEVAMLNVPELEWDALRRLAERKMLSREYKGIEKIARGPLMIFIDESGSVAGDVSYHEKAFALTMAWIAQHQKRWCCLVAFSGSADLSSMRRIVLPPGKWSQADLLKWLEGFLDGGTTVDWLAGETMDKIYQETGAAIGKTDVVVVTDACVGVSDTLAKSCNAWKLANKAKVISLVLGTDDAGGLKLVSDKWYALPQLDVEADAVAEAFSI